MKAVATLAALASLAVVNSPQTAPHARPDMEFEVQSRYGFEDTINVIVAQSPNNGFSVLKVHPMSETLASKGFPRDEAVTIIEVCNAKAASTALNQDMRAGLMMPCPIMVYEKSGAVMVMTYDTRIMSDMYHGGAPMDQAGEDVYVALTKILATVKK